MNYSEYKLFLNIIHVSDNLIEQNKHKECLDILMKFHKKEIPFGLEASYFSSLGECNLKLQQFNECEENLCQGFRYGLSKKYIESLFSMYDSTTFEYNLYKVLSKRLDNISKQIQTKEKIKLDELISNLFNADQKARFALGDARKKRDTTLIKKCIYELEITDSINQIRYDSLCSIYNWITKDLYFYDFQKTPIIVLYHSPQSKILTYLNNGFKLASENKIYWSELLDLQVYSIFKDVIYQNPNNIFVIETLCINDVVNNNDKFCFVLDALFSNYSSYIKGFSNKKIELFVNTNRDDTNEHLLQKLTTIKNKLIDLGAESDQIVIKKEYIIFDSTKNINTIGVKFI